MFSIQENIFYAGVSVRNRVHSNWSKFFSLRPGSLLYVVLKSHKNHMLFHCRSLPWKCAWPVYFDDFQLYKVVTVALLRIMQALSVIWLCECFMYGTVYTLGYVQFMYAYNNCMQNCSVLCTILCMHLMHFHMIYEEIYRYSKLISIWLPVYQLT